MSQLEVDKVIPQSGTTLTLGENGDTITIPSGATIDASGATLTLPTTIEVDTIEPQSGTSLTLGASGDTITIPSGATITNSGTATGFGKVLQVVNVNFSSTASTSGSTFVDTGLSASITPSSASNKIFILASFGVGMYPSGVAAYPKFQVVRDSTALTDTRKIILNRDDASRPNYQFGSVVSINFLDSPSATSSTTYKIQYRNDASSGGTLYINPDGTESSNLTLMEIAG
jgi:hypothetical protein